METLTELLRHAATRFGDRPALTAHRGLRLRTWSYGELWRSANAAAEYFAEDRNLEPGRPVVFWAANSPELVAAMFGAVLARLVVVPIDPSATAEFVAKVTDLTRAGLLIGPTEEPADSNLPAINLAEVPADPTGRDLPSAPEADDLAEIVFTSGTTGSPKGVMLTHGNVASNVAAALELVPARPQRLVSLLPLSHMFEQTVGLFGPLVLGSTIHYPSSRRPTVLLKSMQRAAATSLVVVPQVLDLILREVEHEVARRHASRRWQLAHRIAPRLPRAMRRLLFRSVHRRLGGHLTHVLCGGARLAPDVAAAWERMGVRVVEGYGATECAPIVAANSYWDRCAGSVGRSLSGVEVEVSADNEILVRGPNVFAGYWEAAEMTSAAVDAAGWFHTGDLGEFDDAGRLYVTGRLTDRIVLASGLNVYPEDVESEILTEPAIADCVVVSNPDAAGNPRLWAVVIPAATDGQARGRADVEASVHAASRRLALHQRPIGCTVWPQPDFPRTNLMKVKRFAVAAALGADSREPEPSAGAPARRGAAVFPQLRTILADIAHVDPRSIAGTSSPTLDLGLDSLARMELAVRIEDEFGIEVENGDLADLESVDALVTLVAGGARRGAAVTPATWPCGLPARMLRATLQHGLLFPLHRAIARPFRVEGGSVLQGVTGPVLIVANHSSHADTPSILRALPPQLRHRTAVAAAADYFYRSKPLGMLATIVLGTFPFSREGAVRASLEHCGDLADAGWSILIYPEGTRSTSGAMAQFRGGIGLLATELGVPVVPIGVAGTFDVWPKGAQRPVPGAITVRIGQPVADLAGADPLAAVAALELAVASLLPDVNTGSGASSTVG